MDRRTFLAAVGGAAMTPMVARWAAAKTRADHLDRIGLQLYTLRDAMATSVERTLHEVARIGYREVEFAGYFDRPPRAIRQLLDRNGLKSPSAHVDIGLLRSGWYRTLNEASEMGQKWLVVPSLPSADRDSVDSLKRTAELFNRAALDAKTFKIRVAYHNHDTDLREVEGQRPLDVLLRETDAKLVDFEMDLYWLSMMGADPLAYFRQWPGRFPLLHVKDSSGPPDQRMETVGQGTIDFAAIFAARDLAGARHFYVEHDHPDDPMASVRASYSYLAQLEFDT
jgi:sugar phosphate isomerase/epimerase